MLKNFKKFNAKKFYIKNTCKKTKNFDLGLGSRSRFSVSVSVLGSRFSVFFALGETLIIIITNKQ